MSNNTQLKNGSQLAEYNTAKKVIVCEPSMAMEINAWHPAGNLYEVPVSTEYALQQHRHYQEVLKGYGIETIEVQHALIEKCDIKILKDLAFKELNYVSVDGKESYYTSNEYKQKVIDSLSKAELLRIIMMRPTIKLQAQGYNTGCIAVSTEVKPIGNLVFTRDQQITTNEGIIITNFTAEQRRKENDLMKIFWNAIGYKYLGQTKHVMEGGDFVILDNETQLLGCGLRTSYASGLEIMQNKWVSTKYFTIVKDSLDQDQDRMHLDCVFSPLHEKLVVVDETITKEGRQRFVDEYINTPNGYKLNQSNVEFIQYLKSKNVQIITLTHEQQLAYGCNSLNLGLINGEYQILCAHEESANYIKSTEIFKNYCKEHNVKLNVQYIPFRGITSMYGCLHCASQVVERDNSQVKVNQVSDKISEKVRQDGVILIPNFSDRKLAQQMEKKYDELTKQGKKISIISQHVDTKINSLEGLSWNGDFSEFASRYYDMQESKKQNLKEEDCILLF